MARGGFTGREVAKALTEVGYKPVDRTGSHLKRRYVHPVTDEVRNVTVPIHGELDTGTLHSIAEQCGADDFDAWGDWISEVL